VVDHIRLFPVREDVRWSYAVHEQILPALRRANVPVRWTDVNVRHTGSTDPALRERKLQRDCKILEAELAERPDDPFVLFNLGAIAVERRPCATSPSWPRSAVTQSSPGGSGEWSSTHARATPRPCRAGKHSCKPRRLPPGSTNSTPSASARKGPQDTAKPARKMERPVATSTYRADFPLRSINRADR